MHPLYLHNRAVILIFLKDDNMLPKQQGQSTMPSSQEYIVHSHQKLKVY